MARKKKAKHKRTHSSSLLKQEPQQEDDRVKELREWVMVILSVAQLIAALVSLFR